MANVIGFYGQDGPYGCFSNFYEAHFIMDHRLFRWSEQYIMYKKAELFGDQDMMHEIMLVDAPRFAKRYGRLVSGYVDEEWVAQRRELSTLGIYAKFKYNPGIAKILLGTGDAIIAECSPRDKIWGIGMSVSNPDINNPQRWRGENLLGEILMDVRTMLRSELF